jgi:hypothetical protein
MALIRQWCVRRASERTGFCFGSSVSGPEMSAAVLGEQMEDQVAPPSVALGSAPLTMHPAPFEVNSPPVEMASPPAPAPDSPAPRDQLPVFDESGFGEQWPLFQPAGDLAPTVHRPSDDQVHFHTGRYEPWPGRPKVDFGFAFYGKTSSVLSKSLY